MTELSLYGATAELAQIESLLEQNESEETQEQLAQRMNDLIIFLNEKTDLVCGYNQSLDDFSEAIANRLKELQVLKKSVETKQENFHKYILSAMDNLATKKITGKLYTITYRAPVKSVEVLNQDLLDVEYVRTKTVVEVDKTAIKEAIQAGKKVDGAVLKDGKRSLSFKAGK